MDGEKDNEVELKVLLEHLWRGRFIIAAVTAISLIAGAVVYSMVPNNYEAVASILPLGQSRYSEYIDLAAAEALPSAEDGEDTRGALVKTAFPYTRTDLFNEYAAYLQNPSNLIEGAQVTGVALAKGETETSEIGALSFVRGITFTAPTERDAALKMRVRSENQEALNKFVAWSLENARTDLAGDIKASVIRRIEAGKRQRNGAITQLRVEIDSRKAKEGMKRQDQIAFLEEQAKIAQSLGIREPVALQRNGEGQSSVSTSVQMFSGDLPTYFQGSTALEERIQLLKNRQDGDAFVSDLRDLEGRVYVLENDTRAERLTRLVEQSPLNDPATAPIVEYSAVAATADKIFPRIGPFAIGSLLIGLVLGSGLVLGRVAFSKSK